MITYTKFGKTPPADAILFDAKGRPWKPTTAVPIAGGWLPRWRMVGSNGALTWVEMDPWAPFTDAQPAVEEPAEPVVTDTHRAAALLAAITANGAILAELDDEQLVHFIGANPKNVYDLTDTYARYIATGEHPS